MGWASTLSSVVVLALSVGRIVLGILLIAAPLPFRDGARWRIPLSLLAFALVYACLSLFFVVPAMRGGGVGFYSGQLVAFSLLLVSAVGFFLAIYDTSVWTALFCCSAGYTIQNLASGATELFCSLAGGASPLSAGFYSPLRIGIAAACVVVVYGLSYLLITRYLLRSGLGRLEDRSMVAMMAVVIIVIIGFDLVIKWLTDNGVGTVPMVLLRLFHGLACTFTLTMEFELLIRRRLEAERDTMRLVLVERERQYETAHENVAAINARVHDMRHAVARMASDDGVSGDALRELVREVAVYDSAVRTGNEALDTALTEQGLRFGRAGASLSCIADGTTLAFMTPADTYALFSALLGMLGPTSSTSVVVREALGSASVHIEHAGPAPTEDALSTARDIVGRYQGTLTTMERDGAFHVNVLFPAR